MLRVDVTGFSSKLMAAIVLPLAVASCVAKRPAEPIVPQVPSAETSETSTSESDPIELDRRLAEYTDSYREGIQLITGGEEVRGERRIVSVSNDLLSDAAQCSERPDCEMQPFLDTFNRLLTEQGIALKKQAVRVTELESSAAADIEREPDTSPFTAVMPELGRTASLLRGTELSEIIRLNGPVKVALDDWLTWKRPLLMDAWRNYQFLRSRMAPVYEKAGLPEALLFAMLAQETGGKVHSFSRAGAAGPLQFMRSTGRKYGLKVVDGFDQRLDPEEATRANVAYLNDQFEVLNGSLEMALAAYNGGENRVRNLHRRYGDNLWDPKIYYSLPRETREYVPQILAAAWLFLHPEDYNLEFPVVDSATTSLKVKDQISLNELAVCLGQENNIDGWFRTLRNLNPRLKPGERVRKHERIEFPASMVPAYEERCLGGEIIELARDLNEANYPPEPEMVRYTVRRGDTLSNIASRFGCVSMRQIANINGIRAPRYVIRTGQILKIPRCG
jgi:membrane-bound lytic murein transglycosylase D